MTGKRESPTGLIAWLVGGFVLTMLALFSISGWHMLALLMVLATPLALGFLVMEAIWGKRPVYITPMSPRRESRLSPVTVTVMEMDGICMHRARYTSGSVFTFDEDGEATPRMCGPMLRAILPHVEMVQAGKGDHVATLQCPPSRSAMVVQLRAAERDRSGIIHAANPPSSAANGLNAHPERTGHKTPGQAQGQTHSTPASGPPS